MSIQELIKELNALEQERFTQQGYTHQPDQWHMNEKKNGRRFDYLDCGTSGAFLIEKTTGELFNIKAYGVPDLNKKQKSNLGNLATVDPRVLHAKRWNYLR